MPPVTTLRKDIMGLFDAIKDALTTDDAERLEAAHKALDKAKTELDKVKAEVGTAADPASRGRLEKAEQAAAAAQTEVNELEAKVNHTPAAPEGSGEPVIDDATQQQTEQDDEAVRNIEAMQAKAAEEKAAAEAQAAEQAAAEQAQAEAAAAPAEELAAPAPELRTYTVVKGDNLTKIGKKFGVSWKAIAELNGIANPDLIHPGQVFQIPNA